MKILINTIFILLIHNIVYSQISKSPSDKESTKSVRNYKDRFIQKLNEYNIFFHTDKNYHEVDSIKDAIPLNDLITIPDNILYNEDSSEMIIIQIFSQKKENEDKIRRIIPDWNFMNKYLYGINGIVKHNKILDFNQSDILFYSKKQLKKLNAELGCEYSFKFNEPYLNRYKYGTYRYMHIHYKVDITIFHVFEKNEQSVKKSLLASQKMFKFNR